MVDDGIKTIELTVYLTGVYSSSEKYPYFYC
jgi:hypothetical protein